MGVQIGFIMELAMNHFPILKRLFGMASVIFITVFCVHSAYAQRVTEREVREFMGLYKGRSKILVRAGGEVFRGKEKFRYRARWKPKGSGVVRFENGSYKPVATRARYSNRSIRSLTLLSGSVTDPDSGAYGTVRGIQSTSLKRRGARRFTIKFYQKIHFGPFATRVVKATGKK
ncbi:MAG: hypothetical protein CMO55_03925 [Verrucomicrobiales bacterium]|nr:hypothetical protein [Verrucomicrobiales bacterium]